MFQDGDAAMQKVAPIRAKCETGFKEKEPRASMRHRTQRSYCFGGAGPNFFKTVFLPAPQSSNTAFAIVLVNETNSSSATVDICQDRFGAEPTAKTQNGRQPHTSLC